MLTSTASDVRAARPPSQDRLIHRAKSRLMRAYGWPEHKAYAAMRSAAMNQRRTLVTVSKLVLSARDNPAMAEGAHDQDTLEAGRSLTQAHDLRYSRFDSWASDYSTTSRGEPGIPCGRHDARDGQAHGRALDHAERSSPKTSTKITEGTMLILSRRVGERIVIGGSLTITVMAIRGDKVRLGIVAPKEVPVHRQEVAEVIHACRDQAGLREEVAHAELPATGTEGGTP